MLRSNAGKSTALFLGALFLIPPTSHAADIGGVISTTVTITEDSQLVDDVTCAVTGAACIVIGASRVTLDLNGFTMTGQADAQTGCNGASSPGEIGINVVNQRNVVIRGPGLIQRFRNFGVVLNGGGGNRIREVTVSTTCMAGIFLSGSSDNEVDSNVAIRNGHLTFPCGGI